MRSIETKKRERAQPRLVAILSLLAIFGYATEGTYAQAVDPVSHCRTYHVYCKMDAERADGIGYIRDPNRAAVCRAMAKQHQAVGYTCVGPTPVWPQAKKADPLAICRTFDQEFKPDEPPWVAFSYDRRNPLTHAWCEAAGAEDARNCAVSKCRQLGGIDCLPRCDLRTGTKLVVCRAIFVTIVASPEYARLGCGARYLTAYGGTGYYTPESYIRREMARCVTASKRQPLCRLVKLWH